MSCPQTSEFVSDIPQLEGQESFVRSVMGRSFGKRPWVHVFRLEDTEVAIDKATMAECYVDECKAATKIGFSHVSHKFSNRRVCMFVIKSSKCILLPLNDFVGLSPSLIEGEGKEHSYSPSELSLVFSTRKFGSSRNRKRRSLKLRFEEKEQRDRVEEILEEYMEACLNRFTRKKLLVFVNPYGGKRQAPSIYRTHLLPLLEASHRDFECVVTRREGEVREACASLDLDLYGQVCVIGGDGTMGEAINGLNTHKESRRIFSEVLLSCLPGGSSNSMALFRGLHIPSTAAYYTVKGIHRPMDLLQVTMQNMEGGDLKTHLATCGVSFGFVSEVNRLSLGWRVFGPLRYGLCGARAVCCHKDVLRQKADIMLKSSHHHSPPSPSPLSSPLQRSQTVPREGRGRGRSASPTSAPPLSKASPREGEVKGDVGSPLRSEDDSESWDLVEANQVGSWDITSPEMWVDVHRKNLTPTSILNTQLARARSVKVEGKRKVVYLLHF